MFSFDILKKEENSYARRGVIHTRRGEIHTPAFVIVATSANVRSIDSQDLEKLGAQCALANTYHLFLRPGLDVLKKAGGSAGLMNYHKPWFSDSGGFQAFSLGSGMGDNIGKLGNIFPGDAKPIEKQDQLAKVTQKGVEFKSVYDGTKHFFTPKKSMEIQSILGSDIIMAFDECTSPLSDYEYNKKAMERTHRWAKECLEYKDPKQALYGIIQGGVYEDLRKESTEFIVSQPFEGIAIGGSFGTHVQNMYDVLSWIVPKLDERPRHLLGIGTVEDIFECVELGMDTFDCVAPTRNARRGSLYLLPQSGGSRKNKFRINVQASFKDDMNPIDKNCTCPVCKHYSRAYIYHLHKQSALTYYRLATIHNLHFMLRLMEKIRHSLDNNSFSQLKSEWMD